MVIGSESLLLPAFVMGAQACISGLANVLPELMHQLFITAYEKDMVKAQEFQTKVLKMWDVLHIGASNPTAYAMLHARGFDIGYPRKPFNPIGGEKYKLVEKAMKDTESIWKI